MFGLWRGFDELQRTRLTQEADTVNHAWTLIASAKNHENANVGLRDSLQLLAERGISLSQINLPRAYLAGLRLPPKSGLEEADLSGANLDSADLREVRMAGIKLSGANLAGADLSGAKLAGAKLTSANLRKAKLKGADLRGADLTGADLTGADLGQADLRAVNLQEADLFRANLSKVNLDLADLRNARLGATNLRDANLRGTNFWGAALRGADLRNAHLSGMEFSEADLRRADLSHLAINEVTLPKSAIVDGVCWKSTISWNASNRRWCGPPVGNAQLDGREKGKIYYLVPSLIDEFQTESQKAIEVLFNEIGYAVESLDADGRADVQARQLDEAVRKRPAAIILNAVDFNSIMAAVANAKRQRVPILAYDRSIVGVEINFSSLPDARQIGEMAAEEALHLLKSPNGVVLQITGDPGDSYSLSVQDGFRAVESRSDHRVITRPAIDWDPANAEKVVREELAKNKGQNPRIELIFAHASHLVVPVIPLVTPSGSKRPDVMVIASNGSPLGMEYVHKQLQEAEIEQPLYAQVYGLVMGFQTVVAGKTPTPGPCRLLGVDGTIERDKPFGSQLPAPQSDTAQASWTLRLRGRLVRYEDTQNGGSGDKRHLWGNFIPPDQVAGDIACER